MSLFKKMFSKKEKEQPIETYRDFWNWFLEHQEKFHEVVKSGDSERYGKEFFDVIGPKLNELKEGIFYLSGMLNDHVADLILTPEGNFRNFYIVEELIAESPKLPNWQFQAFKPSFDVGSTGIKMENYSFGTENIHFYANESKEYPDDIEITLVHNDYKEENKAEIINGCYIFLENYLGELKSSTGIDTLHFTSTELAKQELISIEKLESYLIWREKEFVEKYEGTRKNTENDAYGSYKTTLQNGSPFLAIMNTDLLKWDAKASHPWIVRLQLLYDGNNNDGFPEEDVYQLLNEIEDNLVVELKDYEGYLNIGRETGDNSRDVYFACKDFRKPCKLIDQRIDSTGDKVALKYEVYKDKYWRYFDNYSR